MALSQEHVLVKSLNNRVKVVLLNLLIYDETMFEWIMRIDY